MPYKSKRQKTLKINLSKLNCVSLLPNELNDSKLNSQNNKKIENEHKFTENIEGNNY